MARHGWAMWTGLALTAIATTLHVAGLFDRFEFLLYDFNVRHFSRIPASDRILHVDIDDDCVKRLGWPWPRELQADLIRVLHDLGASRIATDIVWPDPNPPRVRVPSLDRYSDIEGTIAEIGELSGENVVLPDDELARAIEDARWVYLSMFYENAPDRQDASPLRGRIAGLLRKDFPLDVEQIAQTLKIDRREIEDVLAGVKSRVAEELVTAALKQHPQASVREIHASLLKTPFEQESADRTDVLAAYQRELGVRALRSNCVPVPPGLAGKLPRLRRVEPPLYEITQGARAVGFVTYHHDSDGVLRRMPLLAEWDGRLVPQLGFAAACDELDIRPEDLSIVGDRLQVARRGGRPAFSIQLDEAGQMLINWHVEAKWSDCFRHIPATQLLRIAEARGRLRDNEVKRQIVTAQAMKLAKDDAAYEGYRQQVNERIRLERQARWGRLQGRGETKEVRDTEARVEQLRQTIEADQKETAGFVDEQFKALQAETQPSDPQVAAELKRFGEAHRLLHDSIAEIDAVNARIRAEQAERTARLRPLVEHSLCLFGYTATAVADMVNTPPYAHVPGVLVHSNILNSLLAMQFRSWSPLWVQGLVIAALGAFVSVMTATRGPKLTAVLVLGMMIIVLLLNASALFYRLDTWLRLVTAMGLMLALWAVIVLLRFLITDRQRRQFSRAVSQYVSPAMARRIADSAQQLDLAPVSGIVTCFFSDIAGFTQASERLGPEGTREVLNPYLDAMSSVLHRHNALINKFMGDGVFAFFNPPILPCVEHQRAACEAALDSLDALAELARRNADHPLAREFQRLHIRIGLASGPVFVGDYGSENKLDYTCMGDTVNLASRLEGANKFFGSTLMVAGPTRDAVAAGFVFRRLGRLQVKGQTVVVPVYELLGRGGQVSEEVLAYTSVFEAGVDAFARRDWDASSAAFRRCLELCPEQVGAVRYLHTIEVYRETPPPPDWNMGIELTEK